MGEFEFIIALADLLRWPIVALVALLALRPQVGQVVSAIARHIEFLEEAKVANVGATFNRAKIEEVKRELPAAASRTEAYRRSYRRSSIDRIDMSSTRALEAPGGSSGDVEMQKFIQVAEINTKAAVMGAFTELEIAIRSASQRLKIVSDGPSGAPQSLLRLTHSLVRAGKIDGGAEEAVRTLATERNKATHSQDFTADLETTVDYIATCLGLRDYFTSL